MRKSRFWARERVPADNLPAAIESLLHNIGVRITRSGIDEQLLSHPYFPSLAAAADALDEFGVETQGVQCGVEALGNLLLPCLAHIKEDGGRFIVLTKVTDKTVTYLDTRRGWASEPIPEFERRWTGSLLLAEPLQETGETNYRSKRYREVINSLRKQVALPGLILLPILAVLLSADLFAVTFQIAILLMLESIGFVLSAILASHYLAGERSLLKRFCPVGRRLGCGKVLDSPAASLFGRIPVADLGALYFYGGVIAIVLAALAGSLDSICNLLAALNVLAIPYTLFSLYYQGSRLRQWCPLCIAVQAVIWIELVLLLGTTPFNFSHASTKALPQLVLGLGLPSLVWMLVRPSLLEAVKARQWKYSYLRLQSNPEVIETLLYQQGVIEMGSFREELVLGNRRAPHQLMVVMHPQCPPCAAEYLELERLLRQFPDEICATLRFLCPEEAGLGKAFAHQTLAVALSGDIELTKKLLHTWATEKIGGREAASQRQLAGPQAPAKFLSEAENLLRTYAAWADRVGIRATPAIYYHGRPLPEGLRLGGMKTYFRSSQPAHLQPAVTSGD